MKKLHVLRFRLLHNAAHYDFFIKFSALLVSAGDAVKAALSTLRPLLIEWLAKETLLMGWVKKSIFTKKIAEADKVMDNMLVRIRLLLNAAFRSPDAAVSAAANRLLIMLKQYGDVINKPYDDQAGRVRAILGQLTGTYAADAATTGVTALVAPLQTAFNTFEILLSQREAEQGQKPEYTFKEVRAGIEDVYRQMEDVINANIVTGASTDFDTFIDILNPDIDRLNAEFHRSRKDISESGRLVIDAIPTQTYTGKPVIVIPKTYYREIGKPAVELVFAVDFSVTYRNNTEVGTADLIIHGKGKYKGQVDVKFNIAEPPTPKGETMNNE